MALGLRMAISEDHSQMPTHAHTMVAGWLMSAVFAFFYHLVPAARLSRLAQVHFWLQAVSGVLLLIGLYFVIAGNQAIEPFVVRLDGLLLGHVLVCLHRVQIDEPAGSLGRRGCDGRRGRAGAKIVGSLASIKLYS